ncbi:MAG: hypothetical protein DRN27_07425 [Thermoplasmata archaeon]|nr:MAG: hypothetical protein DRN27_07425 [Thermoplasmata archaeon]
MTKLIKTIRTNLISYPFGVIFLTIGLILNYFFNWNFILRFISGILIGISVPLNIVYLYKNGKKLHPNSNHS